MHRSSVSGLAGGALALAVGCSAVKDAKDGPAIVAPRRAVTAAQLDNAPLTISMYHTGYLAEGEPWHLSVNSAGQAEVTIGYGNEPARKQFQVSKEQLAQLRKLLLEERFFELNGEYGGSGLDGTEESITVTAGFHTHTVTVYSLVTSNSMNPAELLEPSRAVRVLVFVRGWFDEPEAADRREYNRFVLDAVKG